MEYGANKNEGSVSVLFITSWCDPCTRQGWQFNLLAGAAFWAGTKKKKKKPHIRFDLPVWVIWKHTLRTCCWFISLHKLIWRDSKFKTPLHHLLNKWCRLWNIYVWISSLAPLVSLFQFAFFFITFLPIYIFYVVLLMWKQKLIHCNFKNSKISFAAIIPENQFLI